MAVASTAGKVAVANTTASVLVTTITVKVVVVVGPSAAPPWNVARRALDIAYVERVRR